MSRSGTGAGNPFPCAARILKRIADVFQVWYLGRRANGDCGARDEWIAAHLTLDVLMWIALPRTETARTWADDPRQNAARVWSTCRFEGATR